MNFLSVFEPEERIGGLWHRWVGDRASWPSYPDAAVALESVRHSLSVFFRGLGGDAALQIAAASPHGSGHRLGWRQRLGMDSERLITATRNAVGLSLPPEINLFPTKELNRDLYIWLAAWFAVLEPSAESLPREPFAADWARLHAARRVTLRALAEFPGLRGRYRALADAVFAARPKRRLPELEALVEKRALSLLASPETEPGTCPDVPARRGYRPFLPIPLWGETEPDAARHLSAIKNADPTAHDEKSNAGDEAVRRKAERRNADNADRKDPLILNRFEKILSMADMVNVNRGADDADAEEAKKAAEDMDAITLAQHSRRTASMLKFDLDLPPNAVDAGRLAGAFLLPEWDWRIKAYHPEHCSILEGVASEKGDGWTLDAAALRRIRAVRRRFEALRARPAMLRAQQDGQELDTDALVRARADLAAGGQGSDCVWSQRRIQERDLAAMMLVDASLSTDAWIDNRRVLDVEKEALAVFAHGLAACGDPFAVAAFTSRRREWIRIDTIKDFDAPLDAAAIRRIGAIRPGYYTRIGAAIRYAVARLEKRPERRRLLLILTDGKPNDIDHYEGRYGIEDTRKAVREARAKGLVVFGVTIDRKAQDYFPYLFGRGHFAIVGRLAHLSAALPRIYGHLAA